MPRRHHSSSSSNDDSSPSKKQRTQSLERTGESEHLSDSDDSEDEMPRPVMGGVGASFSMSEDVNSTQGDEDASMAGDVTSDFLLKKTEKPVYNKFAEKMMAKMGFQKGKGLGKHGQGRVEIVAASKQKGRRGLGHIVANFEPSDVEWNYEKEEISAEERIDWIKPCEEDIPSLAEMETWVQKGPKMHTVEDDYEFCDKRIVQTVLNCKTVFDNLEPEEMRRARTRSNPYETIRGAFFQNRAAMKMANMDAVCDFMFTNPVDESGKSLLAPGELLYFADVCAGPGGFSEYVLWRKKWHAKGFGFTLKGPNDFKLEEFFAASSELFEPHYGIGGLEGDGDVFRPGNLEEFRSFVMDSTDGNGVHFVMADGGFDVTGQENLQEWLSKRLYLCECIAALSILRTGGHFVCKLFDIFLPFSVGLVYLMYRAFREISIFKPVTSRPANSERYIICKGLRPGAEVVHDFMVHVNLMFNEFGITSQEDINYIVPQDVMQDNEEFINYITLSNKTIAIKQSISLTKIKAFAQNSALYEIRQAEMREECLKLWQIPDQLRKAPDKSKAHEKFMSLLKNENTDCFSKTPEQLTMDTIEGIKSIYDYRCYVMASEKQCYLLGQGKSYVFRWDGQAKSRWQKVDDVKVELPMNTLLEAEYVQELRGEGKGQRRVTAIHVMDAMVLGGIDIRDLHFTERLEKLRKFVKAITRPTRSDLAPIRVKEVQRFEELEGVFDSLEMKQVKGFGSQPRLCYSSGKDRHFVPVGITFVKMVKEPWMMAYSKSRKSKYFFNTLTRAAIFETPKEAIAQFTSCQSDRWVWLWNEGVRIHDLQRLDDPDKVSKDRMIEFIHNKMR